MSVVVIMNILCFNDLMPRPRDLGGLYESLSLACYENADSYKRGGVTKDFPRTRNSMSYFLRVAGENEKEI